MYLAISVVILSVNSTRRQLIPQARNHYLSLPEERRVNNRPWLLGGLQNFERLTDNGAMCVCVFGRTKGSANRKMHEERSGRFHILGYFPAHHDADGRNTRFFEHTGDQSDGLLADWSARHQQGCLYTCCQQPVGGRWSSHFDQLPGLG